MPADILGVIDGALADYATSDDAMRWKPRPAMPCLTPWRMGVARRLCAATGMDGYAAAAVVTAWYEHAEASPYAGDCALALASLTGDERAALAGFAASFHRVLADLVRAAADAIEVWNVWNPVFASLTAVTVPGDSSPARLSAMHRAYDRRRRARRRRR